MAKSNNENSNNKKTIMEKANKDNNENGKQGQ